LSWLIQLVVFIFSGIVFYLFQRIKKKKMAENSSTTGVREDLTISLKAKRRIRFKAGAELSGAVSMVGIDVDQEIGEDYEQYAINLRLTSATPTVPSEAGV
jgi:hypothetical protein